jgi:phosphate starvation-inducible membrane PsiE
MADHPQPINRAVVWLQRAESSVLILVSFVLIILAVALLLSSVMDLFRAIGAHDLKQTGIEILDSVLLVMMILEIVYTVTVSVESHALVAEPFLIIAMIAAVRRMLVITAESTKVESEPALFRSLLAELALLAATVVAMAVSVYILRKGGEKMEAH